MPQNYFFTTDADSWWLRFNVSVSGGDLSAATASGASLGAVPAGQYGTGVPDSQSFSVTVKQSEGFGGWLTGRTAYYDANAGSVDVPLARLTARMFVGERLFVRLIANSGGGMYLASAELVVTKDKNRKQESISSVIACDDDNYLSFRLSEGGSGFTEAYAGPALMSGGSVYGYQLHIKKSGAAQWDESNATYHDALTGLVDCYIGQQILTADPGDTFDFRVIQGNSGPTVVQGTLTYDPDCEPDGPPPDPSTQYDITANENSRDLVFKLSNFDPDPSQAVVVSVTIGRFPPDAGGEQGVFALMYQIDQSSAWLKKTAYFDDEAGTVSVNIRSILDAAQSSVGYRLVYDGG